jgi:uncharacterized membrane protein (DUF485 family)
MTVAQPLALAAAFLWIGFVCAISFLEAWLKFRAPGVTVPIGLGIGRLVFNALNKIEWVFMATMAASALWHQASPGFLQNGLLATIGGILLAQTLWLLPALDARAGLHISGEPVPRSNLHIYFIAGELIKISLLAAWGITHFRQG